MGILLKRLDGLYIQFCGWNFGIKVKFLDTCPWVVWDAWKALEAANVRTLDAFKKIETSYIVYDSLFATPKVEEDGES
jgi:hypothetical protein